MDDKPTKKYQVWQRDSNWYFMEYDTLKEAVESIKYGEYFITQLVQYEIKQKSLSKERKGK